MKCRMPSLRPSVAPGASDVAVAAAVAVGIGFGWAWLARKPDACPNLQLGASYAGSTDRFTNYIAGGHGRGCTVASLGPTRWWLLLGIAAAVAYGGALWALLLRWWPHGWVTARFRTASGVAYVALAAAGCDIIENVVTMAGLRMRPPSAGLPPVALRTAAAAVLPVLGWSKLLLYGASAMLLLATIVGAWNRHELVAEPDPGREWEPDAVVGLGICCSGGGIRAAAISLGALGALEAHSPLVAALDEGERASGPSILSSARYLASVSGGGYACTAWRTATGPGFSPDQWPIGVIGDPFHPDYEVAPPTAYDSETTASKPSVYRHLQARREFLRTGRGGLPASLLVAIGFLAWHLVVLFLTLSLVAWPMGRLSRMWPVFGGIGCSAAGPVHGDLPLGLCPATAPGATAAGDRVTSCVVTNGDTSLQHSPARTACFLSLDGRQMPLRWGLYGPPVVVGVLALLAFLPKLFKWRTKARRKWSVLSGALAGVAALYALVLLGVPLLLDVVYPHLRTTGGLRSLAAAVGLTGASAGITGAVVAAGRKAVTPRLRRSVDLAGSLLLGLTAVLAGTLIAGRAAEGAGFLNRLFGFRGWPSYFIGAGLALLLYLVANPQAWSLNTLYRNRIRGGFAVSRDPADAPKRLRTKRWIIGPGRTAQPGGPVFVPSEEPLEERLFPYRLRCEPTLAALAGRGPLHLVCCSAARNARTATGVPSLSYVVDAEHVTLYEPQPRGSQMKVLQYEADTSSFLAAVAGNEHVDPTSRRHALRRRRRQAYGTTSAAATASGAAFASAMGRFSKRYPIALFGAVNLRLGVWLPNPRFLAETPPRFPTPDLVHLLKELTGFWRLDDHHLYVSDGGHRENLGLVELLRRRCRTMICIDSSGDTPGSFTTLRQAADLARIEARAVLDTAPIDTPPVTPRPTQPFTVLPVEYRDADGATTVDVATVIHIRPVVYPGLRDELVAFAAEDQQFPHYSTGNQFLTDTQFRHLVQYGWLAMNAALRDGKVADAVRSSLH